MPADLYYADGLRTGTGGNLHGFFHSYCMKRLMHGDQLIGKFGHDHAEYITGVNSIKAWDLTVALEKKEDGMEWETEGYSMFVHGLLV